MYPELGVVSKLVKTNQNYSNPPGVWIELAKHFALMAGLARGSVRPAAALRDINYQQRGAFAASGLMLILIRIARRSLG